MQDIRDYPGELHSVAPPSRYPRAGASRSYHSSSPSPSLRLSLSPRDSFHNRNRSRKRDDYKNDDGDGDDDEHGHEREASLAGSAQQSSDPDEAVFEATSQHSSPGTSHHSDDGDDEEMSEFPPDLPIGETAAAAAVMSEKHYQFSSPYTPHKIRSPFRNPSSVRAMQMDTTPPHLTSSPSSQQRYSIITSPSRNGTSRSLRSSHNSAATRSPSKLSGSPMIKKLKKEYPLVLLHVTLLPIPIPYSPAVMESILPQYLFENWKLLRQKATPTVLERGILIPHPKEDYDLLEERLLESLELKTPRILKCGHFHLSPEEEADIAGPDDSDEEEEDDLADGDICDDCGRRIRDGRFGSGAGSKRWDIKLFAANGLMRAGAWGAAWREMERVDVEIVPWMDEDLKRLMEMRSLEDAEAEETFLRTPSSQHTRAATEKSSSRGGGRNAVAPNPNPNLSPGPGMDEARMREIYGEDIAQAYLVEQDQDLNPLIRNDGTFHHNANRNAYPSSPPPPTSHLPTEQINLNLNLNQRHQPADREPERERARPHQRPHHQKDIPLPTLLKNYIYVLFASWLELDKRNLIIAGLGLLVALLMLRSANNGADANLDLNPTTRTMTIPPLGRYDDDNSGSEWGLRQQQERGGGEGIWNQGVDTFMAGFEPVVSSTSALVSGSASEQQQQQQQQQHENQNQEQKQEREKQQSQISLTIPNPNPNSSPNPSPSPPSSSSAKIFAPADTTTPPAQMLKDTNDDDEDEEDNNNENFEIKFGQELESGG